MLRMPAEWEPHDATWISWPTNHGTFPGNTLKKVEDIYLQIITALHEDEKVNILVNSEESKRQVARISEEHGIVENVFFHIIETADVWIRDYGPIFVRNEQNKLIATKWGYNAYGNKYDDLKEDDTVAEKIIKVLNARMLKSGIILEGGSIEANGKGTLITTEQCLLNKNRNAHLSRQQIDKYLSKYLGISNVIWLKNGIKGDDTDGHVDDMARFVNERTIVCALEEDKSEENYFALKDNFEILQKAKDQDDEKFLVKALPMPKKVESRYGRLPASYANFYIGNGAVLLPVFNQESDEKAIELLEESFPDRKVVPIECTALVYGFGGIHCITQQQPIEKS